MKRSLRIGSAVLPVFALCLVGCASASPIMLVPVDVEPDTVLAKVYLHEALASIEFDPIRTTRTSAANLLDVQCRIRNESRKMASGTFRVEFLDGSERQVSNSGDRRFTVAPGGSYVVAARAGSQDAEQIVITIRP